MPDRPIRIVVASPGDVATERDLVTEVVEELNESVAADRGVRLEVGRWETHAYPILDAGGPQAAVDRALEIPDADLVVGIFWRRFGTPTRDADSGTEHEILTAYRAWEESGRPQVMLYFRTAAYAPESPEELEQWQRVLEFQRTFEDKGLYWTYPDERGFERRLRRHLTRYLRERFDPFTESERPTVRVAVLPFDIGGSEEGSEAYGAGVAEMLAKALARIQGIEIVSPESALDAAGRGASTDEIAEKLGAHFVVAGSLNKGGDAMSLRSQVLRTRDRATVADAQEESAWSDLFSVNARMASRVGEKLAAQAGENPIGRIAGAPAPRPADSVGAAEAYMKGRYNRRRYNNTRREVDFEAAEAFLREAVRLDSAYADALAELGFLYLLRWETEGRSATLLDRSKDYFDWARNVEPDHAVARAELGFITFISGDRAGGLELCTRTAVANPQNLIAQNVLALLWLYTGFYESTIWLTRNKVNALDPLYTYPYTNAATASILLDRLRDAITWARKARAIDADAFTPLLIEGEAHFRARDLEKAEATWRKGIDVAPEHIDPVFHVALGWLDAARGNPDRAREVALRHRDGPWTGGAYDPLLVSLFAMVGECEDALDLLEEQSTYATSYRYLISDRTLERLHGNPRFETLLAARRTEWLEHGRRWKSILPDRPSRLSEPELSG